jgi:hypothetical protein
MVDSLDCSRHLASKLGEKRLAVGRCLGIHHGGEELRQLGEIETRRRHALGRLQLKL